MLPLEVSAPRNDCACVALNRRHVLEGKGTAIAACLRAGAKTWRLLGGYPWAASINSLCLGTANHVNDNRIPGHNPKRGTSECAYQVSVRAVIG